MKPLKIWVLALLALSTVYSGCAADTDDSEDDTEESEDQLGLRKGSVDHAAIVEVTTMMLSSIANDPTDFATLLDPYNQEDPFRIRAGSYQPSFLRSLAKYDAYDRKTDWTPDQMTKWATRISSGDYQVIDTSKPCGDFNQPHTYLEIERARLTGRPHTTCGGRMPNEDALDVTLNFLIRGPAAAADGPGAITDGVDAATRPSQDTFPYIPEMNGLL